MDQETLKASATSEEHLMMVGAEVEVSLETKDSALEALEDY